MERFQRVAIYWTPEPGSELDVFAEKWFLDGKDAMWGAQPFLAGVSPDLRARAVKDPARYRLHATLKAPFRLRHNIGLEDVDDALRLFCSRRRVIETGPLRLTRFRQFIALVPSSPTAALEWLADQCVVHFDRYRAPLDDKERRRRQIGDDQAAQRRLFEEFGYPYIFSAFRFHVTLAGPLDEHDLGVVEKALPIVQAFDRPLRIESLTLLGEPIGGGQFQVISRHPLMR